MEYRSLGKSDLKVSVITFGAWAIGGAMWGGADEAKAVEAIRASVDVGVTTIDTAYLYGFGASERLVAKAVAGIRDRVQILTKFGLREHYGSGEYFFDLQDQGKSYPVWKIASKKSIMEECERSLRDLNTDYIDLYQCHWRDHTTPVEETAEAMATLLKQGKIRAAGVSNFTAEEIETANRIVPIASNQPPYSMVERGIETDVLPWCHKHNIGTIVYSPMQRGLLTGKFDPAHKFARDDHRATAVHFKPENIRRVNAFLKGLEPIAEEHSATIGQVVLNWTIQQPGVTAALVGARDAKQARDNAAAANFRLTPKEIQEINQRLGELKLER